MVAYTIQFKGYPNNIWAEIEIFVYIPKKLAEYAKYEWENERMDIKFPLNAKINEVKSYTPDETRIIVVTTERYDKANDEVKERIKKIIKPFIDFLNEYEQGYKRFKWYFKSMVWEKQKYAEMILKAKGVRGILREAGIEVM